MKSQKRFKIITIFCFILLLVILGGTKGYQVFNHIQEGKKKGPPPTTVSTKIVESSIWERSISSVASLVASEGAILSSEVSGVISKIHQFPTSSVEKGDLLIELDTQVEDAELLASQARAWEAKKSLDRASFLAPRQASSRSELDQAEATYKAREAEVEAVKAKISRKRIRAPFSGKIGIRLVNEGEYVSQGTPLLPLYKIDELFADFSIPQDKSGYIKLGQNIKLNIIERIGSESQNAEVFRTGVINIEFALKILPISKNNSYDKNQEEIEIAEIASQAVLEKRTKHFPIVYGSSICQKTHFYKEDLTNKSKAFQGGETKSHILFSELASCDLKQYLKKVNPSKAEKEYIYNQCMKAISDMHTILKVCHNDLHFGNFLLLPDKNPFGYIILIHDFGMAEYREEYRDLDYKMFEEEIQVSCLNSTI